MRYIGSKLKLLDEIESFILFKTTSERGETFRNQSLLDICAGTGSVAKRMKKHFKVIANDNMNFSFRILEGHVACNSLPNFSSLLDTIGGVDVLDYLNSLSVEADDAKGFIRREYSCVDEELGSEGHRSYFTPENAQKIDNIRTQIGFWAERHLIDMQEESYLIACLIEGVTKVSNTTGTYGAYLKYWERRALMPLQLIHPILFDNGLENRAFFQDAHELVNFVEADICYLDPPYNSRQYSSNYHILETISRYDDPEIKGKTGMRADASQRGSSFCRKVSAYAALDDIVKNVKSRHIFVSYSSDGLLTKMQIEEILKTYGIPDTYELKVINYATYQSKIIRKRSVEEYVFYIEKPFT